MPTTGRSPHGCRLSGRAAAAGAATGLRVALLAAGSLAAVGYAAETLEPHQNSPRLDREPIEVQAGAFQRGGNPLFLTGLRWEWNTIAGAVAAGATAPPLRLLNRDAMQELGLNAVGLAGLPAVAPPAVGQGGPAAVPEPAAVTSEAANAARLLSAIRDAPLLVALDPVALAAAATSPPAGGAAAWAPDAAALPEELRAVVRGGTRLLLDQAANPWLYLLCESPAHNTPTAEGLVAFERWLAGRHRTVATANEQWGTQFASFADATAALRDSPGQAPGPWADWLTYVGLGVGRHLDALRQEVLDVDDRPQPRQFAGATTVPADEANAWRPGVLATHLDALAVACPGLAGRDEAARARAGLAAFLAQAYARQKPTLISRLRLADVTPADPAAPGRLEAELWSAAMCGFSGAFLDLSRPLAPPESAKGGRPATPPATPPADPALYPPAVLDGLARFRIEVDRVASTVLPRPRLRSAVGIVWVDRQGAGARGDPAAAVCADWLGALRRAHVPAEFVVDETVNSPADLSRFAVLLAPALGVCPDDLRQQLEAYVRAGGTLVTRAAAASVNEYGISRNLAPLQGLRLTAAGRDPGREGRLAPAAAEAPLVGQFRDLEPTVELMPGGEAWATWEPDRRIAACRLALGQGRVHTALFAADTVGWQAYLGAVFAAESVPPPVESLTRRDGAALPEVTLDVIEREGTRFYCLISHAAAPLAATLAVRGRSEAGWYVTDAVRWQGLLSPREYSQWSAADLATGVPLWLLPRQRALLLVSTVPPAGLAGEVSLRAFEATGGGAVAPVTARATETAPGPGGRPAAATTPPGTPVAAAAAVTASRTFAVHPLDAFAVDLRGCANHSLTDRRAGDGRGGWTDEGEGHDLAALRPGLVTLAGVPFDVLDSGGPDGQSCIALQGTRRRSLPARSDDLWVNRRAAALYFLHAAAWPEPGEVLRCRVAYEDGRQVEVPIRYGHEIGDWRQPDSLDPEASPSASAVALGPPPAGPSLFVFRWANPEPGRLIRRLQFLSAGQGVPFVVAITGVTREPSAAMPAAPGVVLVGAALRLGWTAAGSRNVGIRVEGDGAAAEVQAKVTVSGVAEVRLEAGPGGVPVALGGAESVLEADVRVEAGDGRRAGAAATTPDLRVEVRGATGHGKPVAVTVVGEEDGWVRCRAPLSGAGPTTAVVFHLRQATRESRCTFRRVWAHPLAPGG